MLRGFANVAALASLQAKEVLTPAEVSEFLAQFERWVPEYQEEAYLSSDSEQETLKGQLLSPERYLPSLAFVPLIMDEVAKANPSSNRMRSALYYLVSVSGAIDEVLPFLMSYLESKEEEGDEDDPVEPSLRLFLEEKIAATQTAHTIYQAIANARGDNSPLLLVIENRQKFFKMLKEMLDHDQAFACSHQLGLDKQVEGQVIYFLQVFLLALKKTLQKKKNDIVAFVQDGSGDEEDLYQNVAQDATWLLKSRNPLLGIDLVRIVRGFFYIGKSDSRFNLCVPKVEALLSQVSKSAMEEGSVVPLGTAMNEIFDPMIHALTHSISAWMIRTCRVAFYQRLNERKIIPARETLLALPPFTWQVLAQLSHIVEKDLVFSFPFCRDTYWLLPDAEEQVSVAEAYERMVVFEIMREHKNRSEKFLINDGVFSRMSFISFCTKGSFAGHIAYAERTLATYYPPESEAGGAFEDDIFNLAVVFKTHKEQQYNPETLRQTIRDTLAIRKAILEKTKSACQTILEQDLSRETSEASYRDAQYFLHHGMLRESFEGIDNLTLLKQEIQQILEVEKIMEEIRECKKILLLQKSLLRSTKNWECKLNSV